MLRAEFVSRRGGFTILAVLALALPLRADPLLPPLTAPFPIAGQSSLTNPTGTSTIRVDWIVAFASGLYYYYYQLENPTSTAIEDFVVYAGVPWLSVTILAGDLDSTDVAGLGSAHTSANYANLGGAPAENEFGTQLSLITPSAYGPLGSLAIWTFFPSTVGTGRESVILYGTSAFGPRYGTAVGSDGFDWSSTNPGGEAVPVPAPEPGSFLLLGTGLLGIATVARYRLLRRA
jgi:hypothetical protein